MNGTREGVKTLIPVLCIGSITSSDYNIKNSFTAPCRNKYRISREYPKALKLVLHMVR